MVTNNVNDIIASKRCCGCLSCVNSCPKKAITSYEDEIGFTQVRIDTSACANCGICLKNCPMSEPQSVPPLKEVIAAESLDEKSAINSASGGIFPLLAKELLHQGHHIVGSTLDEKLICRHIVIHDEKDLPKIQGSKYVQSSLSKVFAQMKALLEKGEKVCFAGVPCQVSAMKKHFACYADNLFLIDVVCHGVPCQRFYKDYVVTAFGKQVTSYKFRPKLKCHNYMEFHVSATIKGRVKFKNWPEDSYNFLYESGATYRESCYQCQYASPNRVSDVTLCDYWHWEESLPTEFQKDSCVSGIVINTERGENLVEKIKPSLHWKESTFEALSKNNGCLIKPTDKPSLREKVMAIYKSEGYVGVEKWFNRQYKRQILKYAILRKIRHFTRGNI